MEQSKIIDTLETYQAATTTTSRLRAAVAERVMATVAGNGVAATTATSHLRAMIRLRRIYFPNSFAHVLDSNLHDLNGTNPD